MRSDNCWQIDNWYGFKQINSIQAFQTEILWFYKQIGQKKPKPFWSNRNPTRNLATQSAALLAMIRAGLWQETCHLNTCQPPHPKFFFFVLNCHANGINMGGGSGSWKNTSIKALDRETPVRLEERRGGETRAPREWVPMLLNIRILSCGSKQNKVWQIH